MDCIVHGIAESDSTEGLSLLLFFLWEDHISWILLDDPAFYAFFKE